MLIGSSSISAANELAREQVLDVDTHALFSEGSTTDPKAKGKQNFREIAGQR